MAFLPEVKVVQLWEVRGISVHRKQISEVLRVLGREWVHCEVTASKCVHESVQRALQHVEKRIPNWILLASAER